MTRTDCWNPEQYLKFSKERDKPFYDLFKLVNAKPGLRVVDLGCGTGKLTRVLHDTLKARETLGIDTSEAMLREAGAYATTGLTFRQQEIEVFAPKEPVDLIFSNAALQWLPEHRHLFKVLRECLADGGQLAIQMPANFDAPTHTIAAELALEAPFKAFLGDGLVRHVLIAEEYASLLYDLGFAQQDVHLQVYPIVLESAEGVIEWVKGSLLTYYQGLLPADLFQLFLTTYRQRILSYYGDVRPLFFPFKRLLIWATI